MKKEEIIIDVNGGSLIVERNFDPDYDGVTIFFKTTQEDIADIALIECKAINNYEKTDVYVYGDEYSEDWTNKFTIEHNKIQDSFKEREE